MYQRTSLIIFKKTFRLPAMVNNHILRKAIRTNASYATEGTYNPADIEVLSSEQAAGSKIENCLVTVPQTPFEPKFTVTLNETPEKELARCFEPDVKAYFLLYQPPNDKPFYVVYDNPAYRVHTNKVATINYRQYSEYYQTKVDNFLFTVAGCGMLVAGTLFVRDRWKNNYRFTSDLAYLISLIALSTLYPVSGLVSTITIFGAYVIVDLCVEAARPLKNISLDEKIGVIGGSVICAPFGYLLFRSDFKSAFARGLFVSSTLFCLSLTSILRKHNKKAN